MSDIVKRLREEGFIGDQRLHGLLNQAADRIEELERHTVPLAVDGESVFIDGRGEVPLCAEK